MSSYEGRDSSLFYRIEMAARHVRRAERSGGQRSEGDARRYYGEHKNSRAMTFEQWARWRTRD
jgi:hypothetical protein